LAAAIHHGLSLATGAQVGAKGGYFGAQIHYASEMGQTFWTAIVAWTTCFIVTIVVSSMTRPRPETELRGLVYALTPKPVDTALRWHQRPIVLAGGVLALTLLLNLIFI
jgi:SSS family solute:Na+ symporter